MILTEGQSKGLDRLRVVMSTPWNQRKHVVICGAAGVGKTYLLKQFLDTVGPNANVAFCAPTHQAKSVMAEMIGQQAHTIHALMKIHPETYEDAFDFKQSDVPDLGTLDYLVIDEVSMMDGLLFDITLRTLPSKCLIVGLGDPYQIQPVKNDPGIISPIFFDDRFERIILNEVVRQSADNPIIKVATEIRKNGSQIFECRGEDQSVGVYKHSNINTFMAEYFKRVQVPEDMLKHKIMAYTNNDVDSFNGLIRQRVYNTTDPIVEGEYLVMQEPVYQKIEFDGKMMTEIKFHNGETVKVLSIVGGGQTVGSFSLPYVPHLERLEVKYYTLKLESIVEGTVYDVDVIFDSESASDLSYYLHCVAGHYKKIKSTKTIGEMKKAWRQFWELKERFKDVKGAAACTFHKSQGSTFESAFIITNKLNLADRRIRKQLEYVGVTRAKNRVDFI